jgi:hypothetical protein
MKYGGGNSFRHSSGGFITIHVGRCIGSFASSRKCFMSAKNVKKLNDSISGHVFLISKGVPISLEVNVVQASGSGTVFYIEKELELGQEIGLMLFGIPAGYMNLDNDGIAREQRVNCKTRAKVVVVSRGHDSNQVYKVQAEFIGNLKIEGINGTDFSRF